MRKMKRPRRGGGEEGRQEHKGAVDMEVKERRRGGGAEKEVSE